MFPPVVVFPCFHQLQLQEGSSVTRLSQYSRGASWLSGHFNRCISCFVVSSCIEHDGKPGGGGGSFALHSFTERWCVTGVGSAREPDCLRGQAREQAHGCERAREMAETAAGRSSSQDEAQHHATVHHCQNSSILEAQSCE